MSRNRLPLIDFLKGYSIFTIVVYHILQRFDLPGFLSLAINFGAAGIYVFILCSGFGLFLSQQKRPLTYFQFLRKRLLKIYVPYILVVLVAAAIPFVHVGGDRFEALLSHVFLFKMFDERYINSFGEQFWFISMIIQFYFFFPLLYTMVNRYRWKALAAAFIVSLVWPTIVWILGKTEFRVWNSFFLHFLWVFVLGMVLAARYGYSQFFMKRLSIPLLLVLAVVGITLTGISGASGGVLKLYNDIPSMVGYLSFALLIYAAGIKWLNRFFIYTNQFSYEWYLLHMLVIDCVLALTGSASLGLIEGIVVLATSYVLAIGYHRLLKPVLYAKI
ncbi:acyltransferase family protein [Parapedobacter sp. 2B3]|uniref:acyltransferase family protein n=1 Tax=Parapedobacter sp. 2B3 TaxID=3342381 RepID=UPI0035B65EF6